MVEKLQIVKTRKVKSPARAHKWDAGIDFFMPEDFTSQEIVKTFNTTGCMLNFSVENSFVKTITLNPGDSVLIPSGIKVKVPEGYVLNFENKSGIASKKHLLFGSKVIDCGYEGIVHINLHNVGKEPVKLEAGDKIAQALMYKIEVPVVEECENEDALYGANRSDRGEGGFGSTGNA